MHDASILRGQLHHLLVVSRLLKVTLANTMLTLVVAATTSATAKTWTSGRAMTGVRPRGHIDGLMEQPRQSGQLCVVAAAGARSACVTCNALRHLQRLPDLMAAARLRRATTVGSAPSEHRAGDMPRPMDARLPDPYDEQRSTRSPGRASDTARCSLRTLRSPPGGRGTFARGVSSSA
ncbi:hypothetical protein Krad_2326 [Kineococcus radiotolerans SRS30216 = ATCC BAA-149]|uniref:Uncharacterized protein n=1 Tax=Kineococcus radiotolerans (strain ATCC BAA-149 / DSM 14245 / SRS30216) TaxID=266940 RepID=A6WAG8_KINRD|nr:hypothetical protein Krad_2326 [Kineococcus radiotolerans SRS30216 = ATCC BAA-149]